MALINLLPWREARLNELKREYISILIVAVLIVGIVVMATHWIFSEKIDVQKSRNQVLQSEITRLNKDLAEIKTLEKEKQGLIQRMEVVIKLESTRNDVVYLLSELVKTLPNGVFITKIVQSGKNISLDGLAQSNARVSEFMSELDRSEHFANPRLSRIDAERVGAINGSKFAMRVNQQYKR